jgi:hypothetical protein
VDDPLVDGPFCLKWRFGMKIQLCMCGKHVLALAGSSTVPVGAYLEAIGRLRCCLGRSYLDRVRSETTQADCTCTCRREDILRCSSSKTTRDDY